MQPGDPRTPAQIVGELLAGHPEAASLLSEASHRQALACVSAVHAGQAFTVAQAIRLACTELRHRLDPRCRRTVHFGAGLLVLAALGAGLTLLDIIELGGMWSVTAALAATVMWLTGAWLAAVASRERRWPLVIAGIAAAVLLSLLLTALQGFGSQPGEPPSHRSALLDVLVGVCLFVLVVGAAVLMARMESASLFLARRRWHRARAAHDAAVRAEQDDREAMTVAAEAWLSLVRIQASTAAGHDERIVRETVTLAAALLDGGRARLPGHDGFR